MALFFLSKYSSMSFGVEKCLSNGICFSQLNQTKQTQPNRGTTKLVDLLMTKERAVNWAHV